MADNKHPQEETPIENLNNHLTEAGQRLSNNTTMLYWIAGAVIVVAALVMGYIYLFQKPKVDKAYEAFNKVETTAQNNDSVASVEYKKVADQYGSTDAGKLAALSAAESFYNLGKYKEAITYLEKFSSSDPILEANALILLGDCYVNTKNYDKALEVYQKAVREADNNPQISPRALLKEANIYDEQKKYDKALECYNIIKTQYPDFQMGGAASIDAYIERENARLGK